MSPQAQRQSDASSNPTIARLFRLLEQDRERQVAEWRRLTAAVFGEQAAQAIERVVASR